MPKRLGDIKTAALEKTIRVHSIDALRGITIFVMIFVNDLAGTPGVPAWMGHMPADADAMSFVDVVFPAFLFIAGMSVPFAIANRQQKGDSWLAIQAHILWRVLGLLVLGFFMVNGEEGLSELATGLPVHVWLLLFYAAAILTWNAFSIKNKTIDFTLRAAGILSLLVLAWIFRAPDGISHMKPHWWGILGLIGWAYLYTCIFYQLFRGSVFALLVIIAVCSAWYGVAKLPAVLGNPSFSWISGQAGNAAHTSVMLCGVVLSQIFFRRRQLPAMDKRFLWAGVFAAGLFMAGYLLRPYYKISKIYATPTWCLYSAAWCVLLFALLYWIIDIRGKQGWTSFFRPAATNPLFTYIIPGILFSAFSLLHISLVPARWRYGITGIIYSLVFAVLVMLLAKWLTKKKIRMQL